MHLYGGFDKPRLGPSSSYSELLARDNCMSSLVEKFGKNDDGSRAACNLWLCLQNNADSLLISAAKLVSPHCTAIAIIVPVRFRSSSAFSWRMRKPTLKVEVVM